MVFIIVAFIKNISQQTFSETVYKANKQNGGMIPCPKDTNSFF